MKNLLVVFLAISMIVLSAQAQVPKLISHQGYIANAGGQGVNATLPMTFRFFADSLGGAAVWTQSFPSVQISKGVYSVNLNVDTVATFYTQYWL